MLYGLIHARFIITGDGLSVMHQKYIKGDFGTCPRVFCNNTHVLPTATTDNVGVDTVKLYCPSCNDIYEPDEDYSIDGAFFGTTFAQLFMMTYPEITEFNDESYQPTAFGFKIHPSRYFLYFII